ncbi:MAG: c-type cytochrome [Bacteroidetes bacterium]|nr:c-type cytochrome [Bacteroidota bacterium]
MKNVQPYFSTALFRASLALLVLGSCVLPDESDSAMPVPYPAHNPGTPEGAALGRALFYDPILSGNNQRSCATCHDQVRAFSHQSAPTSLIDGKLLDRNTPSLANAAWLDYLFWDGGAPNLEFLMAAPITNPHEMGQDLRELMRELGQEPTYVAGFKVVFDADSIEFSHVGMVLAQFVRTMTSFGADYDKWINGGHPLPELAQKGYQIYKQKCASCHTEGLFTDKAFHNNGLDREFYPSEDGNPANGRYRVTKHEADLGKYKTPSLRNLAYTAPFMHDGRFADLPSALGHYVYGVVEGPYTDTVLLVQRKAGTALSDNEIGPILAFLETLNDPGFTLRKDLGPP